MNIADYIRWRGDIDFKISPFNEADSLIISQLPYLDFSETLLPGSELTLAMAMKSYFTHHPITEEDQKHSHLLGRKLLFQAAAGSVRFRNLKLFGYVRESDREEEMQFSAISVKLPDRTCYVCYEGTDNTMIGWKENFNMSYMCPVPAQKRASEYLKDISAMTRWPLRVGGHSKGGNLAMYAAYTFNHPQRILEVYNIDGPGFNSTVDLNAFNEEIHEKITTFIPQGSVVGRLMNNETAVTIIESEGENLYEQHNVMTWKIDVTRLVRVEKSTSTSEFMEGVFKRWNEELSYEEKVVFLNIIFDTLTDMGIETISALFKNKRKILLEIIKKLPSFSDTARTIVLDVTGLLLKSNALSFYETYIKKESRGN